MRPGTAAAAVTAASAAVAGVSAAASGAAKAGPPAAAAVAQDARARLDALIAGLQSLYEDLDFQAVRRWKAEDPARKAIGFLPIYVPREVIHACGALPVGILGGGDRLEIVRGDSYFQSYICHLPRSVIELALSGRLDALDGFLFPSICDVIRNLSGMFKLLLPDRFIHYLDLPQDFDPRLGGRFYRHELELIRDEVSRLTGRCPADEDLRASIRAYNLNRAAIERLFARRAARPWEVPTTEYALLLRAGYVLPVEEHTGLVGEYLALAEAAQRHPLDNIRVLVRGAFCEQPPLGLLRTLERAGCYVVDDDLVLGARFIPEPLDEACDPIESLIRGYMEQSLPTASKYDARGTKGADLVQRVRAGNVHGVILVAPSFCDPALLDQPMLQKALEQEGIPFTTLKYSEDTGQFQVIREQAGTFADSVKLWGAV
jgi:benzoyl-CoA reductase subunit C